MKIQNFFLKDNAGHYSILDIEHKIQRHCSQGKDLGLSDSFQVLYDSPSFAIWRLNEIIYRNDDYVGQFWIIDLTQGTIKTGIDCSVVGKIRSYKERKLNCSATSVYTIAAKHEFPPTPREWPSCT